MKRKQFGRFLLFLLFLLLITAALFAGFLYLIRPAAEGFATDEFPPMSPKEISSELARILPLETFKGKPELEQKLVIAVYACSLGINEGDFLGLAKELAEPLKLDIKEDTSTEDKIKIIKAELGRLVKKVKEKFTKRPKQTAAEVTAMIPESVKGTPMFKLYGPLIVSVTSLMLDNRFKYDDFRVYSLDRAALIAVPEKFMKDVKLEDSAAVESAVAKYMISLVSTKETANVKNIYGWDEISRVLGHQVKQQLEKTTDEKERKNAENGIVRVMNLAMQDKVPKNLEEALNMVELLPPLSAFYMSYDGQIKQQKNKTREEDYLVFRKLVTNYAKKVKVYFDTEKTKNKYTEEQVIAAYPLDMKQKIDKVSNKDLTQKATAQLFQNGMKGTISLEIQSMDTKTFFTREVGDFLPNDIREKAQKRSKPTEEDPYGIAGYDSVLMEMSKDIEKQIKSDMKPKIDPMDVYINLPSDIRIGLDKLRIDERKAFLNLIIRGIREEFKAAEMTDTESILFLSMISDADRAAIQKAGAKKFDMMDKVMFDLVGKVNKFYIKDVLAKNEQPAYADLGVTMTEDEIYEKLTGPTKGKLKDMDAEDRGAILGFIQKFLEGKFPADPSSGDQLLIYGVGSEEDKKAVQAEKDSGKRAEIVKGIISKLAMEVMTKKS